MGLQTGASAWIQQETIFITGATGFLGQGLLHKLLKLGCQKIFVLIRRRKNHDAEKRLNDLFNCAIFKKLEETGANLRRKVIGIGCDSNATMLGISMEDLQKLHNEVTVVLHSAATVKFDEPLKDAIITNVRMTRDMLLLAKNMNKLKVFHYISTAYSNCEYGLSGVEEKIYEPKMNWKIAIEAAETLPYEVLNSLEKKVLGASPNTYVFTKQITEGLVGDFSKDFPIVISRPTVVVSAWKEPYPGWVCNLNSPVAIMYATSKGVLRASYGSPYARTAYIHVDYVSNLVIMSSYQKAVEDRSHKVSIYNSEYFSIPLGEFAQQGITVTKTLPVKGALWHIQLYSFQNRHLFLLAHVLLHFIPGLIFDGLLKLARQKPRLTRVYRSIYITSNLLLPFTNCEAKFITDNTKALLEIVRKEEHELFCFDEPAVGNQITWEYAYAIQRGIRIFVGLPPEAREEEITHCKRLYFFDTGFKIGLVFLILWNFPLSILWFAFNAIFEHFVDIAKLEVGINAV